MTGEKMALRVNRKKENVRVRFVRTKGCGSSISNKCWEEKMLFVLQSGGLTTTLAPSLACITPSTIKRFGKV